MAVRQLSNRLPAALLHLKQAATAGHEGLQQQGGRHTNLLQQLLTGLKQSGKRPYCQGFQPSRLYPKKHESSETMAFWGIVGLNAATTFLAKSDKPEVRELVSQYFKTSVAAVSEGRWYTLLTSSICHTSVVHCAVNLLLLALYRRTQPLSASEVSTSKLDVGQAHGSLQHCTCCLQAVLCAGHKQTRIPRSWVLGGSNQQCCKWEATNLRLYVWFLL